MKHIVIAGLFLWVSACENKDHKKPEITAANVSSSSLEPTGCRYELTWDDSSDNKTPVEKLIYNVYVSTQSDKKQAKTSWSKIGYTNAKNSLSVLVAVPPQKYVYVTAVDEAGNESDAGDSEELLGCGYQPVIASNAEVVRLVETPIDLFEITKFKTEMLAKANMVSDRGVSPMDCRPISNENVPFTLLCLSASKLHQNKTFMRASIFSEGSKECKSGELIPFTSKCYSENLNDVGGHDIIGSTILTFFEKISSLSSQQNMAMNEHEKAFKQSVIDKFDEEDRSVKFAVITAHVEGDEIDFRGVVSHEAIHAQYFLNENIQETVRDYWYNDLTAQEKQFVLLTLGQVYDAKNEFVILNEFLAYLVQSDAGSGPLADLIPKHQDQIVQEIKETANINVFQFK